jgi:branched-chain amino acid transport system permease protein
MHVHDFLKQFWDLTVSGLAFGAIYALIALGYTLVYGVLRLINFANSEVFMLGTFGPFVALKLLGIESLGSKGYPYRSGIALIGILALMLVFAMAFSTLTAVGLERLAYRPLRKRNAPRLNYLISAIGASFVLQEVVATWGASKREQYALPRVLKDPTLFTIGQAGVHLSHVIVIVGALVMMLLLTTFVSKTRVGRGIRAVAQDGETARLMGVNTDRIILITFIVGGLMAGGAAFLFEVYRGFTRYNTGFQLGVKAFTAAVLGGIGNIRGALVGGLLLGLIETWTSGLLGIAQWKDVSAFVVLVLVLLVRPTGLLGESLGRARA